MISESILSSFSWATFLVGSVYGAGMVPLTGFLYGAEVLSFMLPGPSTAFGLLLGLGLGIIMPEGIEAVIKGTKPESPSGHAHLPMTTVAVSLIAGFAFTFVFDRLLPSVHYCAPLSCSFPPGDSAVKPGAHTQSKGSGGSASTSSRRNPPARTAKGDGFNVIDPERDGELAFGLIIHALSDGLVIGSSLAANTPSKELIILIIVYHKAPTAFSLMTSLLASGVDREVCKMCLAIVTVTTPIAAALFLWILQSADGGNSYWAGIAMLISGGSFLYIPAVFRPVSSGSAGITARGDEIDMLGELIHNVWGMFLPLILRAALS